MIHKIYLTQGRHAEIQVGDHDDEEANDHEDDLSAGSQAGNALGPKEEKKSKFFVIYPYQGILCCFQ